MTAGRILAVIEPAEEGEGGHIADRLIDLRGMHGGRSILGEPLVRADKLEAPRQRGGAPEDFGVEEVAHADDRAADPHGDHDAVERPDVGQFVLAGEQPEADQQADGGAVAGHAAVTESGDDGPGLREILHGIVEEAVAETRSEDRGDGSVDEDRLGDLRGEPFAFAEVVEEPRADEDGQRPHQSVITDFERSDAEQHGIEIPHHRKGLYQKWYLHHSFKFLSGRRPYLHTGQRDRIHPPVRFGPVAAPDHSFAAPGLSFAAPGKFLRIPPAAESGPARVLLISSPGEWPF